MILLPPQFTEAWGGAYIQVAIVLLIFALGIPSLIFQITAPEYIKQLTHRYLLRIHWPFLVIAIIFWGCALSFVWCLHPCNNGVCNPKDNWIASGVLTGSLSILVLLSYLYIRKSSRESICQHLENRIKKGFKKYIVLDAPKLKDIISDFITLGEKGEPGPEKELVISAFNRISKNIQDNTIYDGSQLEPLLRDINKIIINKEKHGNENNFILMFNSLYEILDRILNLETTYKSDSRLSLINIENIAASGVELKYESVVQTIISRSAPDSLDLFSHIGRAAIQYENYLIALVTLNKLESLVLGRGSIPRDKICAYCLGLLAHFWCAGASARRRARLFLDSNRSNFSPGLYECVRFSINYHYNFARFETADKLIIMRDELFPAQRWINQ